MNPIASKGWAERLRSWAQLPSETHDAEGRSATDWSDPDAGAARLRSWGIPEEVIPDAVKRHAEREARKPEGRARDPKDVLVNSSPRALEILKEMREDLEALAANDGFNSAEAIDRQRAVREWAQASLKGHQGNVAVAYDMEVARLREVAQQALPAPPTGVEAAAAELRGTRAWNRARERLESVSLQERLSVAEQLIAAADLPALALLEEELPSYFDTRGIDGDSLGTLLDRRRGALAPAYGQARREQGELERGYRGVVLPDLGAALQEASQEASRHTLNLYRAILHAWPSGDEPVQLLEDAG